MFDLCCADNKGHFGLVKFSTEFGPLEGISVPKLWKGSKNHQGDMKATGEGELVAVLNIITDRSAPDRCQVDDAVLPSDP